MTLEQFYPSQFMSNKHPKSEHFFSWMKKANYTKEETSKRMP
jgi:hypothetical protein